jgi:hypothetical protein
MVRSSLLNNFLKSGLVALLCQFTFFSFSQNLVPNPSFEQEIGGCFPGNNNTISTVNYAVGWSSSPNASTADLYCVCKGNGSLFYINNNSAGSQTPRSDSSYAGIVVFDAFVAEEREYIQVKLIDTLTAYQAYKVGFYISYGENFNRELRNLGAYLGDTIIYSGPSFGVLNYTPQILNNPSNSLYNPTGWTLVNDTMYAYGTEKYIVIGNFFPDSNSIVYAHPGTIGLSYYYIDDVFVIPIPGLTGIKKNKTNKPDLKLYPNPSKGEFTIEQPTDFGKNRQLQIFDISGKLVYLETLPAESSKYQLLLKELVNGLYFYKINSGEGEEMKHGKIILLR